MKNSDDYAKRIAQSVLIISSLSIFLFAQGAEASLPTESLASHKKTTEWAPRIEAHIKVESKNDSTNTDRPQKRSYNSWQSRNLSSEATKKIEELSGMSPLSSMPVPVMGIASRDVANTWGAARSGGRSHEGTDIMAARGTFILSPSEAVVTSIGWGANGGNYVYTTNPGGERFYYAHLDSVLVKEGDILEKGDVIGKVGNTGNASATAPHLHFGIYTNGGAVNPYVRLNESFAAKDIISGLKRHISSLSRSIHA